MSSTRFDRRRLLVPSALLGCLGLLTGGLGCLAPKIHGLDQLGDYYGGRILICLLLALVPGVALLVLLRGTRLFRWAAAGWTLFVVSCAVNVSLGQDPLAAWLNWRAPLIDYERGCDGMVNIDSATQRFVTPRPLHYFELVEASESGE